MFPLSNYGGMRLTVCEPPYTYIAPTSDGDQCKSNPRVSGDFHPIPVNRADILPFLDLRPTASLDCITGTSKFSSVTRKENERYYLFNSV